MAIMSRYNLMYLIDKHLKEFYEIIQSLFCLFNFKFNGF